MTSYITAEFTPKNKESLQIYSAKAASTIAQFKGEFLVKGLTQVLVGASDYQYKAIIAFPSKELALGWFDSPEYQQLIDVRNAGMIATFILIT